MTVIVEPVIGDERQINLQLLPRVTQTLKDIVDNEIVNLVYPKKLIIPLPCVNESFKVDCEGRKIE